MEAFRIYFAGALFNHKELIGNALLAASIESRSSGRLQCALPQHVEVAAGRTVDIRNQDLLQVISCELALFNFDGPELDSGTVVEFMLAKMLDIPAVILRTDFRIAGDQPESADKWNLMCSGYPRTKVVIKNAMALYHQARKSPSTVSDLIPTLYDPLADEVIAAFEEVRSLPSLFHGDEARARTIYEWALTFPGEGIGMPPQELDTLLERKVTQGLI